ncbi:MAG: serine acetyltransferase [Ignavibacteriae bacterium]|nr:serine acetyltransferase [Ignavibacteriota bacterium]
MDTHTFASRLKERRDSHALGLQVKESTARFVQDLLALLFPHFCREEFNDPGEISARITLLQRDLTLLVRPFLNDKPDIAAEASQSFVAALPSIHDRLWLDAAAIHEGDPAAESIDEVVLAYPGFTAIAIHRFAHKLYALGIPVFPRLLTEYAHQLTGIDIHPGATIGSSFAIDHGTGLVIGESTVIGNHVKVYQGVTLGALSVDKKLAKSKRHPTIEDHVVIYAQAVILGGATTVGHHSIIGGNVWLTESVPPYSFVQVEHRTLVRSQTDPGLNGTYVI